MLPKTVILHTSTPKHEKNIPKKSLLCITFSRDLSINCYISKENFYTNTKTVILRIFSQIYGF